MRVEILREVEEELGKAIAEYEELEVGLGIRLMGEVRTAISWIAEHPFVPRLRSKGYRRLNLRMFRYYIAYTIEYDSIWILTVAHSARHPEYWSDRDQNSDKK